MTAARPRRAPAPEPELNIAGRVMPSAPDAERGLLGSILIDPDDTLIACADIEAEHFTRPAHVTIWTHIRALEHAGSAIDLVTLHESLRLSGELDAAGGVGYLTSLGDEIATSAYAETYASIILERASLRRVIRTTARAMQHAYDGELDDAITMLGQGLEISATRERKTVHQAEITRRLLTADRSDRGLTTGYPTLDHRLKPLKGGRLYVLAARPSMGKSMLALNLAYNVASSTKRPVLFASIEMPAEELQQRLCAQSAGIPLEHLDDPDERTLRIIESQLPRLQEIPLYYEDDQDLSVAGLELAARRLMREHGDLAMIVVDYLQLISIAGKFGSTNDRVAEISRSLKKLARRLDIPVIVLSQLSRSLESRPDRRPMLSDLRDSGAVEQDADVVMFIYRDEYYDPATAEPGVAEIIIGKQRAGKRGTVKLHFRAATAQFVDPLGHAGHPRSA